MNPTAAQLAAIGHPPRTHIRIEAGPGSGKTFVLAERAARMVREGIYRPDQVAMLTYTRSMAVDLVRRVGASMPAGVPCPACKGAREHVGGWSCSTCSGTGSLAVGQVLAGTLHSVAARLIRQSVTDGDPWMAQVLAEFLLAHAEQHAPQPHAATDMDIDGVRPTRVTLLGDRAILFVFCTHSSLHTSPRRPAATSRKPKMQA